MTNAELAILSLISETPRHGYEIEQTIEKRGMREWTEIGFSSIYYLLNKLEKAGLVESQLIPTQGRGSRRRVYQITAEGREALSKATLERKGLAKRLGDVAGQAESQRPLPDHVEILFDYSLVMLGAEKEWVEKVIRKLEDEQTDKNI